MPSTVEPVILPPSARQELPAWMTKYALIVELLRRWGILAAIAAIPIGRNAAGYALVDAFLVLLAFFCSDDRKGGIKGFCQRCHRESLAPSLAAIGGRQDWPRQSSMSRLLTSLRRDDVQRFREVALGLVAGGGRLAAHPLGAFRDAHGQPWAVFDLDGVVKAFRQRALPQGADLPDPRRRSSEMGAPGYSGRKRGETQISSHRVQHAGTGSWVGQESVAGNTPMTQAAADACEWLAAWCTASGIDRSRVVLRIDGAGGNEPCANAVRGAGFHLLARTARYEVLQQESVREYLRGEVFYPVPSSMSGPARHAAELGAVPSLSYADGAPMRTVVTRFPSGQEGEKSGAGCVIGPAQYEMFATDLDASAWPAEESVELYYGRSGGETVYGRLNKELGVNHTFCEKRPGQDFAVMVGMLLWNLEAELGLRLLGSVEEQVAQPLRGPRVACRFDDIPSVAPKQPPVVPQVAAQESSTEHQGGSETAAQPSVAPQATPAQAEPDAEASPGAWPDLQSALADLPGWQFDPAAGLLCPNGQPMRLHRQDVTSGGDTRLNFRARATACALCPIRSGCTSSTATDFAKEARVLVKGKLPQLLPLTSSAPQPARLPCRDGKAVPVVHPYLPPTPPPPGPFLPMHPSLVASELRRTFGETCRQVRLNVRIDAGPPQPIALPDHIAPDAARRQHRRRTRTERLEWNANPGKTTVEYLGGELAGILLRDGAFARRAA